MPSRGAKRGGDFFAPHLGKKILPEPLDGADRLRYTIRNGVALRTLQGNTLITLFFCYCCSRNDYLNTKYPFYEVPCAPFGAEAFFRPPTFARATRSSAASKRPGPSRIRAKGQRKGFFSGATGVPLRASLLVGPSVPLCHVMAMRLKKSPTEKN